MAIGARRVAEAALGVTALIVAYVSVFVPARGPRAATATSGGRARTAAIAGDTIAVAIGDDTALADGASAPRAAHVMCAAGGDAARCVFVGAAADAFRVGRG